MELTNAVLDPDGNRRQQAERLSRTTLPRTAVPRVPATAHRQLLLQGLRRFADRTEN